MDQVKTGHIRILRKRVGEPAEEAFALNELHALQKEVGGHIEVVQIAKDLAAICDEEWLLKGKRYNCDIGSVDFGGTILLVGVSGEEFTDCPLTPEQARRFWPQLMEVSSDG